MEQNPCFGYTDDLILLNEDKETIKLNTTMLMKAGKELGLEINTDKTKYMVSYKNGDIAGDIDIEGNMFEQVEKIKYLEYMITRKNEIEEEIKVRLKARNACYFSVTKLLTSRILFQNSKTRIYKTTILTTVLYGCEKWPLTLRDELTGESRRLHNA